MNILDKIMKPKSIAVIGASTKEHTIGSDIMKRLQEYNFNGKIYPVNPKGGIIEGLQAYTSVLEVPGEVDLAIIVVNAKFVLSTIDQCHEKGIKGLCIITAGFKETGKEGAEVEKQLVEKIKEYGMRCVGPNCLGVVNTHPDVRMDGCFAESLPERGNIGFVSQSGALGGGILNILKDLNLGFAQFISIGNQADVNAETALEYWENDEDVKQILLYMESIQDPANFRKLATRITKKKPILALKSGRSAAGASAARAQVLGTPAAGAQAAENPSIRDIMRVLAEVGTLMGRQAEERAVTVAQAAEAALAVVHGANVNNAPGIGGRQTPHLVEQFLKLHPPKFDGTGGPEAASLWTEQLEKAFEVLGCTGEERVSLAVYQL